MKKLFEKKAVVLSALLLALGLAVYLNYYFASVPIDPTDAQSVPYFGDSQFVDNPSVSDPDPEDYFTTARNNRQTAHQESLDLIRDVMNDVKATEEMQKQAAERLTELTGVMEQETKIENLVKAAGFEECLAYIEEQTCYVVVRSAELTAAQALQITGIAVDQSGIPAQKISIVTVE